MQTNLEGQYAIEVGPDDKVLTFSFIGYALQNVTIGDRTTVDVVLNPERKVLNDVVVVGYGTRLTKDITGSVSKIGGDQIVGQPVTSFDQALIGKSSGVQINTSGGTVADAVTIRIRGVNSISNNAQPLIVIDGIPTNSEPNLNNFESGNGTRYNPLADINPNDIQSIEVLKDAAAAGIYGSRAANGVILITTKRGTKGTTTINYDFTTGFSQATKLPKLLNGDDFIAIQNEKATNRFGTGNPNSIIAKESDINKDGVNDRINWMDLLFRNGWFQTHNLSMSGGSDKVTYYGSTNYSNIDGILHGNSLQKGGARMNLDVTPKSWIKAGVSLAFSKSLNKGVYTDRYLSGASVAGYNAFPTVSPYDASGDYNLTNSGLLGLGNNLTSAGGTNLIPNAIFHPIATIDLQRNNNTVQRILSNFYVELEPLKGLKFTTKYGVDLINNYEDQYSHPKIAGLGNAYNGLVQVIQMDRNIWNWTNYVTYTKTIKENHNILATAGMEYQYFNEQQTFTGANNFADPRFSNILSGLYTSTDIVTGESLIQTGGSRKSSGFASYFGRLSYSFKNKYYIEGLLRNDAYSGFGKNYRNGYFPGGSIGWRISEEEFMKSLTVLNDLKIRASLGVVGNSNIGEYASRTLYGGGQYASLNGISVAQAGRPDLRWESSRKFDVGFDAALLKSRLMVTVDYFQNNLTNLVLNAPVLLTTGLPGNLTTNAVVTANIGSMYNKGIELTVTTTNIQTDNFSWTTSFNFSTIKNKVTKLIDPTSDIVLGSNRASVGRPLGVYKLQRWAGVNPQTGLAQFYDKDGNIKMYNPATQKWTLGDGSPTTPLTANDEAYQEGKTGLPTWFGGMDNTFTYRGVDLVISFQYSGGNYILNQTRQSLMTNGFSNNIEEIKNRWQAPGQQTDVPRLYLLDNISTRTSTRWLEKGNFLRLRLIALGYTFPKNLLGRMDMSRIHVSVGIQNAFVLTRYKGMDPEVNTTRNSNNIQYGLDNRSIPQARTYSFGLSAAF